MIKLLALLLGSVLLPHLASAGTTTCPAGAPSNCAISIQGVPVAAAMPTDGQGLVYSVAAGAWLPLPGNGSGTVTSVALSAPSWLTVGGSPVTTTGTLALTGTSEAANLFLAAPNGSSGALTPRAIVSADFEPSLAAAVSTLCSASTTNFVRGDGTCVAPSGSGTPVVFTGVTATSANAQTMASPTPSGFTFTNQFIVQFLVGAGLTNTGATTLSVNSTTAEPVEVQSGTSFSALTGGELQAGFQYTAVVNTACTCYVLASLIGVPVINNATSATITQAQWSRGAIFNVTSAGQTFTLPVATSLSSGGNVTINAVGVSATIAPNAADGINGGSIGSSVTVSSGVQASVFTVGSSGTGAFTANPLTNSGISGLTTNTIPKATSSTAIGNSSIVDNTNITIGDPIQNFSAVTETMTISTATFTPDMAAGLNHQATLVHASCPCTIANPSNISAHVGETGMFDIIQSSTGSDTIGTWGSQYITPGGTSTLTLSTGANAVDHIAYRVIDSTHVLLAGVQQNATH